MLCSVSCHHVCPGWVVTSGGTLPAPFQYRTAASGPEHTLLYQRKTNHYRGILANLFLNCWAKPHFTIILRILLKIPAIWCVIVAASCVEVRQHLLKVAWRLELREQLGTFVTSRLLTQNDEGEKGLTGMKREKNRRAGRQGTALAFENRLLCGPVMK